MTQTQQAVAIPNSAVLNMAPGANLSAYIQAVGGIAVLSAERERDSLSGCITTNALIRPVSWCSPTSGLLSILRGAIPVTGWPKLTSFRRAT